MPQIYDMGPTALLPRRRAEDFFALKVRQLRPGLNPRTWVLKASTLPLDHRSHYPCFVTKNNTYGLTIPSHRSQYPTAKIIGISRSLNNSYLTWSQFQKVCCCVNRSTCMPDYAAQHTKDFSGLLSEQSQINLLLLLLIQLPLLLLFTADPILHNVLL